MVVKIGDDERLIGMDQGERKREDTGKIRGRPPPPIFLKKKKRFFQLLVVL